jgi:nucleotide-binding universal stress UspA family protein
MDQVPMHRSALWLLHPVAAAEFLMMNSLRSILLHIDASPRSAVRLQLARELGLQHEAAVTALYAVTPSFLESSFTQAEGSAELLRILEQMDADRRAAAKARVDREQGVGAPAMTWADLGNEPVIEAFAAQAFFSDLMVLGQHDPNDPLSAGVPADFVESVLMTSGKPALIVPYAGAFADAGREALIAWKPTREAARAVAAALPLLQRAHHVHVVGWTTDTAKRPQGRLDLAAYLRSHGVEAQFAHHSLAPVEAGAGLLSLAADIGADLLVMGCYGHTRARELLLGGASRTILRSMTLPVLMAH